MKVFILAVLVYFFTGCAGNNYRLDLIGSEDSKEAYIKFSQQCKYKIDDVTMYESSSKTDNLISNLEKIKIFAKTVCSPIYFRKYSIIGGSAFFISSPVDDLISNKRFNCQLEYKIANINFLKCGHHYKIVTYDIKDTGYDNKAYLDVQKDCFYELKDFLSNCQNGSTVAVTDKGNSFDDRVLKKLEKLQKMYSDGLIDKDEYDLLKKKLLDK